MAKEVWIGLRRINSTVKFSPCITGEWHTGATTLSVLRGDSFANGSSQYRLDRRFHRRGRKLVAAAMRIQEAFPKANVRAFALVRTMGLIPDVERLFDPCEGAIRWDGHDANQASLCTSARESCLGRNL